MGVTSAGTSEKNAPKRRKQAPAAEPQSRIRILRIQRGLTQQQLAALAGVHRNTVVKLENGTTHEVTSENAASLASALKTTVPDLGLRVRASGHAPSIRLRQLTPEQRQIVDELLSLPPEDYALIRGAIEQLRRRPKPKRPRGARG